MAEKLLGALYATDDWVDPQWGENIPPRDNSQVTEPQKSVEKWWEERATKSVHPRIQPFLKHSLCSRSEKQREEEVFKEALGALSEE